MSNQRDQTLEACVGQSSQDCISARIELRIAAAEFLDAALSDGGDSLDERALMGRHMLFLQAWQHAEEADTADHTQLAALAQRFNSEEARRLITGSKQDIEAVVLDPILLGVILDGGFGNGRRIVGGGSKGNGSVKPGQGETVDGGLPVAPNKTATQADVANHFQQNRQFWTSDPIQFSGNKVYQRNDLIDPNRVDPVSGKTNLELMQAGRAPLGPDGKSINLHHLTQSQSGAIAEVTQTLHSNNHGVLHMPNTVPSGVNRTEFNAWRRNYWRNRANDF